MDRSAFFYFLLGAVTVIVPAIVDRLLKNRIAGWLRYLVDLLVCALTAVILVLVARPLGLCC